MNSSKPHDKLNEVLISVLRQPTSEKLYYPFMFTYFSADVIVNFLEMQGGFLDHLQKVGGSHLEASWNWARLLVQRLLNKVISVHSSGCFFLHFVCFMLSVSALVSLTISANKRSCSRVDRGVTLSLLVGAIVLEIYGAVSLALSDWILSRLLIDTIHNLIWLLQPFFFNLRPAFPNGTILRDGQDQCHG